MHINLSLYQNEKNIFKNASEGHSRIAESFIDGILERTPEISLFLNPIANSYERLGKFEAPRYVSWSHQNRSQLVRIPAASGEKIRMELRSPDPSLNPYLAFALILAAGLDGIEKSARLPRAVDEDLYTADINITKNLVQLPDSLEKAIILAEKSSFLQKLPGAKLLSMYIEMKKNEANDFNAAGDKARFYNERYFTVT